MPRAFLRMLQCFVLLILASFAVPASAVPTFPEPKSFVTDSANLIVGAERAALESELKALEKETGWEVWVVTIQSLEGLTIERYAQDFFEANKIGKKEKNNGVLLLLAHSERKVRIHTGYHAESVIPDAIAKRIITKQIAPKTKKDDWSGGLADGTREIIRRVKYAGEHPDAPVADGEEGMNPWLLVLIILALFLLVVLAARHGGGGGSHFDSDDFGGGGYYTGGSSGSGGFGGGGGSSGGGGASGGC